MAVDNPTSFPASPLFYCAMKSFLSLAKLITRRSGSIARASATLRLVIAHVGRQPGVRRIVHSAKVKLSLEELSWANISGTVTEIVRGLRHGSIPRYGQPTFVQLDQTESLTMEDLERRFADSSSPFTPLPAGPPIHHSGNCDVGVLYTESHTADHPHEYIAAREREGNIGRALLALPPSKITKTCRNLKNAFTRRPIRIAQRLGCTTPDVVIYSRPAAELCERLSVHPTPLANDCRLATLIMKTAAEFYDNKADRRNAMLPLLEELFGIHRSSDIGIPIEEAWLGRPMSFDAADTIILKDRQTRAILCGIEFKVEGAGSGMAHLQAPLTFQRTVSQCSYSPIRASSCCPTFLMSIDGPNIAIYYAIFADTWMFKKILRLELTGSTDSERRAHVDELARVAREVRQTLDELRTFYSELSPTTPSPVAYLPDPTPRPADPFPPLQFIDRLTSDLSASLFRAELREDKKAVVVKFCDSYDSDAHNVLATHKYAPELIGGRTFPFVGSSGRLAIMESSSGYIPAHDKYHHGRPLPDSIRAEVEKALSILHAAGFVHGDVRRENILVPSEQDQHTPIMLVGLGLAGRQGQALYPPDLVLDAVRSALDGAGGGGVISRDHDLEMFRRL